jgi:hypothetical protein
VDFLTGENGESRENKNEIPHLPLYKWGISNFNLKQIFVEQKMPR